MPHRDNYRAEMDLVNAHGIYSLSPDDFTTPIRMAAFVHCANAKAAMQVVAEMGDTAERLSGHAVFRVGDFMDALAAKNARDRKVRPDR